MSDERSLEKQTARLEAFSDGVFAVAITLLVIDLKVPVSNTTLPLLNALLDLWPSYLAFVTSFMTILVMWMNHHNLFNYIWRVDRRFMLLNGILLLFATVTPFTTSIIAEHVLSDDAGTAAGVYSGVFILVAIVFNALWHYASSGRRLMEKHITDRQIVEITRQYYVGPIAYVLAFLVAFVSGIASLLICLFVMGFYAVTATLSQ